MSIIQPRLITLNMSIKYHEKMIDREKNKDIRLIMHRRAR